MKECCRRHIYRKKAAALAGAFYYQLGLYLLRVFTIQGRVFIRFEGPTNRLSEAVRARSHIKLISSCNKPRLMEAIEIVSRTPDTNSSVWMNYSQLEAQTWGFAILEESAGLCWGGVICVYARRGFQKFCLFSFCLLLRRGEN